MLRPFNPRQFNVYDQDADNSSESDSSEQDNGQSSSDSFDQLSSDTLTWTPMPFGVEGSAPSFLGWGANLTPSAGSAPADGASPSASATLGSSPGGAAASGSSTDAAVATANAASVSSSGDSDPVVSTPGSGLVFDNTYTASCTAAFEACIVAAEKQLESLFTNTDTIVVTFGEQNEGNNHVALGNSSTGFEVSYDTLKAALLKVAPGDVLPATDPSGGGGTADNWYVPDAYGRVLGLWTTTGSPDLSVTLNTYYSWDFGQDVINGLTHELSEGGLGRIGGMVGQSTTKNPSGNDWSVMDLFRYNAAGEPDYTNGRDGETTYFSNDGGATLSNQNDPAKGAPTLSYNNQFNSSDTQVNTGDTADWTQTQVFGSTSTGETLTLTQTELDVMEALGWNLSLQQDVYDEAIGGWESPANWSTGSMPITPQDAYISGVGGAGALVTLNSNVTVHSIATSAGTVFGIGNSTPSTLIAIDGTATNSEDTGTVVTTGNLGQIGVEPGSALQIGNTFTNAGTLAIGKGAGGSGDSASLYLNDTFGPVTLNGGGTLDLGQVANASKGEIQTYGDILNAPGTSDDGLYNVDNTITGAGLINLGTFDNQASGKVDASQSGSHWLHISAGTFTNEGFMTAESGATLDLGDDGATETLTNTGDGVTGGAINIDSSARLAISGNFTAAGDGDISFKGAGADITSDGAGATTFTNDSTIALQASLSSSGPFSGQIGDQGVLGVNDLTFVNDGTTGANGSGFKLTINTGSHIVTNATGGTIEAEGGATVAIDSNVNNQGTIAVGATTDSGTTTGTVDLGQDGATGSMTNSGTIVLYGASDLAIRGNYTITTPGLDTSGGVIDWGKGAGAEITSDGKAPATFTNASTINAGGSGQIGDAGVASLKGVNDLTFHNTGSVVASGLGTTLTINTGSHIVTNTGGGIIQAENTATVALVSNVINQSAIEAGSSESEGGASSSSSSGASTGTVDLGQDGGTGSMTMTDTGLIAIYGDSDLAISGNYTLAGSGTTYFKGAGAEITSDGKGPATLTNTSASTIEALASGQIGDEGILGVNDLTFVNAGTTYANGSGVTLTLNTGSHTINDRGGKLEAENGATLAIDSNVDTGVASGTGGIIDAGSDSTVILSAEVADGLPGASVPGEVFIAAGGTFEMLAGSSVSVPIVFAGSPTSLAALQLLGVATVSVSGSNGLIEAEVSGDTIRLTSGTGDTMKGAGFTVIADSGTGFTIGDDPVGDPTDTVDGSNVSIGLLANSQMTLSGSSDQVTATTGDSITLTSGAGDTITGAGFTVTAASGTGLTVGGNSVSGPTDTVDGSHLASLRLGGASDMTLNGSSDKVTMLAGSNLTVSGSTDTITATTGDNITVTSGSTGDTITGAGFTVTADSGTELTVGGDGVSGPTDTVDGSPNATVGLEASSHMTLSGSSDTVTMGASSNLTISGSTDTITATTGDVIAVNSGADDTIVGSHFIAVGESGTAFKIVGTADVVYGGLNDTLTDGGMSTDFKIKGNVGALMISSFDPTGVIDLLAGDGGYKTAAAAFGALTGDGSGGSLLSLGVNGSIDLLGVAPSSLKLRNFMIG
jgi:hypothetical protein